MIRIAAILFAALWVLSAEAKHYVDNTGQYYQFICPFPNSSYNNINTLIAVRQGSHLDISDIISNPDLIEISSEDGTLYPYEIILLSDGKTLNIDPLPDFPLNSNIHIEISGLKLVESGIELAPLIFDFKTSQLLPASYRKEELLVEMGLDPEEEAIEGDRIFPTITTLINTNPSNGNLFMGISGQEKYIAILDSAGTEPIWNEPSGLNGNDFKVNLNDMLTYYNRTAFGWNMINEMAEEVALFVMVNGYNCDDHDFLILENGHAFMQAYDVQTVDMSTIVVGGHPFCQVEGYVMQELDENGGLVMQWRSWDHFVPTENTYLDLTDPQLFLWHGNAIEIDSDENILFSFRNIDEITKVDRNTGDIIWRWGGGGSNTNDFNFTNDNKFTYQHDIRRLENGNLMLYDNANYNPIQKSRCVEYSMNVNTMTVTRVWQYEHPDGLFAPSMGGCRRLEGGNTIINWGNVVNDSWGARVTEVTTDGTRVLEYAFPSGYNCYRTYKTNWFFDDEAIGCPDPAAINYNPNTTIPLISLCQYDYDGDGYSAEMGDCDDDNESIGPDAEEIPYDLIDQDCDGADLTDVDGDGFSFENDCDDLDDLINPNSIEIPYDGIDQDCSGADLNDIDEDGVPYPEDCDDLDETIGTGVVDIPNDGIDQDCSGADFVDMDGDGFDANTDDCNDNDININPGSTDIPDDGIDQDCSGFDLTDVDNDGFSADSDCNDNDNSVNPDATEIPNDGIDQDCSGADFVDIDGDGFDANNDDCDDANENVNPDMEEIPSDGIDQDCDGEDLVAIEELFRLGIQMYPVPASENIFLRTNSNEIYSICVYSNSGELVFEQKYSFGDITIPCNGWSNGVYRVEIKMGNRRASGAALVMNEHTEK